MGIFPCQLELSSSLGISWVYNRRYGHKLCCLEMNKPTWIPSWRRCKDQVATTAITAGGGGVLIAILAIFLYLLYTVLPLFDNARIEHLTSYQYPSEAQPLYLAMEAQGEVALTVLQNAEAEFFSTETGALTSRVDLSLPGANLTLVAAEHSKSHLLGLAYSTGQVRLLRHQYRSLYSGGQRHIEPYIEYPYGQQLFALANGPLKQLTLRDSEQAMTLAAVDEQGRVAVTRVLKEQPFLNRETTLHQEQLLLPNSSLPIVALHLGAGQRWLYQLHNDGSYVVWNLKPSNSGQPQIEDRGQLFDHNSTLASSAMLIGGVSLLVSSASGQLSQHFMTRSSSSWKLVEVRRFISRQVSLEHILPEQRRKGFVGLGETGELQIYHTTANKRLLSEKTTRQGPLAAAALSAPANRLLTVSKGGEVNLWAIANEHPEVSWSALWSKVWYESYPKPDYVWQSSASSTDFEPKYSFTPLAFGTLKAAFYAMLIAAPLAICAAIYTAYFMAPALRRKVKPLIELMEAMPTVILGFLAGLWLAPLIEARLAEVVSFTLFTPPAVLLFALVWSRLPSTVQRGIPPGWHSMVLIPVILLLGFCCYEYSHWLEIQLFGGNLRHWLATDMGISFDQRNALVVGIAMGMAVIPTIFSIAEDAIFSVPGHLSDGSLALGATPWQTMMGVILPTASPGIFSALMIGMGRAVGETMIVLMATGNTPIMDANIFEGMRTLAANIAMEVPETEVNSTHYRVLFLAALVLFAFTFTVNTVAELIRQRLRMRYGSL